MLCLLIYSMPKLWIWPGIVFFYVMGICVISGFIIYKYAKLIYFLKHEPSTSTNQSAINRNRKIAIRVIILVVSYLILWGPVIAGSFYEWIHQHQAPPAYNVFAGVFIHFNQVYFFICFFLVFFWFIF